MVLQCWRHDDEHRTETANRFGRTKEAFNMHDSLSSGGVFYGRTLIIVGGIMALAVLLNLI
jgi:hypothetical protein